MDNKKPFIIEDHIKDYTKKLTSLAESKIKAPVLPKNPSEIEKKFYECRQVKWAEDMTNFVEPEVIPSIWQCEVMPKVVKILDDNNCCLDDEKLKIKDDGKSAYFISIVLPNKQRVDLCINDEGWSTIEDDDCNVLWDGPSSCDSISDGLDTAMKVIDIV